MLRSVGYVISAPAAAFLAWQGAYVTYNEYTRNQASDKLTPQRQRLYVGSTDDMIMDSLGTGDVLLFRRPWYKLRPFAACRSLVTTAAAARGDGGGGGGGGGAGGQEAEEADAFDHCAVVVRRRASAKPEVLEWTDSGVKLTTFDKHLLKSCATSVWLRRYGDGDSRPKTSKARQQRARAAALSTAQAGERGGGEQHMGLDGLAVLAAAAEQGLCTPVDGAVDTRDKTADVTGTFHTAPSLADANSLLGLVRWAVARWRSGGATGGVGGCCGDPAAEFVARVIVAGSDGDAACTAPSSAGGSVSGAGGVGGAGAGDRREAGTAPPLDADQVSLADLARNPSKVHVVALAGLPDDEQQRPCRHHRRLALGPAFPVRSQ